MPKHVGLFREQHLFLQQRFSTYSLESHCDANHSMSLPIFFFKKKNPAVLAVILAATRPG